MFPKNTRRQQFLNTLDVQSSDATYLIVSRLDVVHRQLRERVSECLESVHVEQRIFSFSFLFVSGKLPKEQKEDENEPLQRRASRSKRCRTAAGGCHAPA